MIRLSDLQNARIRTLDGEMLGRVHEVHADRGRVVALTCGPGSFVERLTAREHGRRVPWESVVRISDGEIFVTPDPPQRKIKSAPRNRPHTRQPSGRRSKR